MAETSARRALCTHLDFLKRIGEDADDEGADVFGEARDAVEELVAAQVGALPERHELPAVELLGVPHQVAHRRFRPYVLGDEVQAQHCVRGRQVHQRLGCEEWMVSGAYTAQTSPLQHTPGTVEAPKIGPV
jgi:hypothetical protein